MPLRWKLLLSITIPVLLIFLVMGVREYSSLRAQVIADQSRLAEAQATFYASRFDGELRQIAQIARSTAAFLSLHPDLNESDLYDLIDAGLNQDPLVYGACIAFEPGSFQNNVLLFAPYAFRDGDAYGHIDIGRDAYDYTTWEWYATVRESGTSRWTEPYFDEGAGNVLMCTYSAPFFGADGAFRGVATVDIPLELLQAKVDASELKGGLFVVVSRQGRMISHPDPLLIMTTLEERAAVSGNTELIDVQRRIARGESGFLRLPTFPAGVPHWMYFTPIESTGWSFAAAFPESEVFKPVYESLTRLSISMAVGLIVMLLAIVLVSFWITHPISVLADGVRELAGGNMSARITGVRSKDELGDLARAFNTMVEKLDEHVNAFAKESAAREAAEGQLRVAREVQRGLLPKDRPDLPGYAIAGWNEPADETGGDYFDWQELRDSRWAISIADVTGHGIGPALVTAFCRAYSRASIPASEELGACMNRINDLIHEDLTAGKFVTFAVAIVDPRSHEIELLSAGHGPILLYRAQKRNIDQYIADGLPLGIMDDVEYGSPHQIHLDEGDMLVLLTDGFFEWANEDGKQFGVERLCETIISFAEHSPDEIIEFLHESVKRFVGSSPQSDDLTIVVIKRTEAA